MPRMDLLTTRQAAEILDVHPATISRWVKAGLITPEHTLIGAFFFDPAVIEARRKALAAVASPAVAS